jgi:signal peptidase I
MKKALHITGKIFTYLVVAVAIFMMIFTVISVSTFNRNDRDLFGYKAFIVKSDSMAKTDFDAGSLIFVKEVDPTDLKAGDIITFISQNPDDGSFGETVTHKIRARTVNAQGDPAFITYGTTTGTDDAVLVTYPFILGKYQFNIPFLGHFFNFLKSTPGYFVCIFIPFMVLILTQATKFFSLFRRYKKEQTEEMEAEKAKIEADREENARMMKELLELKAQLAKQNVSQDTAPAAEEPTAEAGASAPEAEEPTAEAEASAPEAEASEGATDGEA